MADVERPVDVKLIIGVMYAEGKGVPQDRIEAVVWFTRSAWGRNPGADDAIMHLFQSMTPEEIELAKERARKEGQITSEPIDVFGEKLDDPAG